MLTATHTINDDLLRALKNWHPTLDEAKIFFACVANVIDGGQAGFGAKCRRVVVDLCDQAYEEIDLEEIEQQEEQEWNERVQRPLRAHFPSMVGFDALTVRGEV